MEINITKFFNTEAPMDYSASVAEIGMHAGPATWDAAQEAAEDYPFLQTGEEFADFREWVGTFGAWDPDEIGEWSPVECNALLIQFIAGDIREAGMDADDFDWGEYENAREYLGENTGNIFRADDGAIYFYMGS